jgi:hypothetical protein
MNIDERLAKLTERCAEGNANRIAGMEIAR